MLPIRIRATGCYMPSVRVTSADFDERFGLPVGRVEELTGVHVRYYVNELETSPYMGARAVADALQRAGLTLQDVDALVSVSGTAAQLIPCTASLILRELGALDAGIPAFDFNATCLTFIVGLETMAYLIAAGRYNRVVLVASDASSVFLNPRDMESAALIGDAAAAIVLERTPPGDAAAFVGARMETHPRGLPSCELRGLGTTLHPKGARPLRDEDLYFRMNGQHLFRLTLSLMPAFLERFLRDTDQQPEQFDCLIPHQASGPAVRNMLRQFLAPEALAQKVFLYLAGYGNVGAASLPLGIHLAAEQGRIARGDRILLVGTGAGLSLGAASFVY